MNPWPKHPVIYEINSWVWLNELSRKYERPVTLAAVPAEEWDYLSSLGADAVWFMGAWEPLKGRSHLRGRINRREGAIY
jgi:hypothetical protein